MTTPSLPRGATVAGLTLLALVAFAGNSLLCRAALGRELADPVTFTTLRLVSGAALLVPLARRFGGASGGTRRENGSWGSALPLFAYALAFSLAYVALDAGVGALLLFGAVQATMIGIGLARGERPRPAEWVGLFVALGGLLWLVLPGLEAPDPLGSLLMALSGVAWGIYSLRGRGARFPVLATTGNFARTVPMALLASGLALTHARATAAGVLLAVVSGALTSGLGYVVWYRALRDLTATRAAIVQLSVPVLTAAGGVLLLGEGVTRRLVVAALLILGGVAVAVAGRPGEAR